MTPARVTVRHALLVVPESPRLSLDTFAARADLHPELIRRFVALGLVPATPDAAGRLWFEPADLALVPRIRRLRSDLGLNYAALGLVLDLLERIHQLESAAARAGGRHRPWT